MTRPALLLVEPDHRARLRAAALLSDTCAVRAVTSGPDGRPEDPLRIARQLQPRIALISLSWLDPEAGLRLCRMLKTDLTPVQAVGVRLRGAAPPEEEIASLWLADGIFAGPDHDLPAFTDALLRGERPRSGAPPPGAGILLRALRRLRR